MKNIFNVVLSILCERSHSDEAARARARASRRAHLGQVATLARHAVWKQVKHVSQTAVVSSSKGKMSTSELHISQ